VTALPFDAATIAAAVAIVFVAYTVFGLTGFGSSITAAPFLVLLFPLRFMVPMMVVLDLVSASTMALRNHGHVAWRELGRLAPWIAVGMLSGVTLLVHAPERPLLALLALFVLGYLARAVLLKRQPDAIAPRWAAPFGAFGGVFTALFGTGGPVYAIFLTSRIADKNALRATNGMLILATALARIGLFAGAALYAQPGLVPLSALLIPVALAGLYVGGHLHVRWPAARVVQAIQVVLFVGALNLLRRVVLG
jgi:uncharacterized membrane protein YfcA